MFGQYAPPKPAAGGVAPPPSSAGGRRASITAPDATELDSLLAWTGALAARPPSSAAGGGGLSPAVAHR